MSGKKTLIIVDVQKGFVTPHSAHVPQAVEAVQHRFDHVVFTKFHNPIPSPFRSILDYRKLGPGSVGTDLAVVPREDALIVDRPLYTCLTPRLRAHLGRRRVCEVYVCGIATEACVLKTVLDLFEAGIKTWVIRDLCASDQGRRYHDMSLKLLAKLVGKGHIIGRRQALRQVSGTTR